MIVRPVHPISSRFTFRVALFAALTSGWLDSRASGQTVYPSVVLKSTTEMPAADGAAFDAYGNSVGLYGDRAVIGAPNDDTGALNSHGSAYVRERNLGGPNAWGQVAKLTAPVPLNSGQFGRAVGIDGSWVVVTEPGAAQGAALGSGAAYVYTNPGLAFLHKIQPASGLAGQGMGNAVAVDASMSQALVGAVSWYGTAPSTFKGAAYAFDLASGVPTHALFGDKTNQEMFGAAVALGGGYYAVGAPGNASNKGAVFVFSASSGTLLHKIVPVDVAGNDKFGTSVDIDGGLVAIGSPGHDGFIFNYGAIYIYDLATGVLVNKVAPYYADGGGIGYSVALAGDEVYTNQGGTSVSGQLQTCGSIHQIHWPYGYIVASHTSNSLGGGCSAVIGNNLSYSAGTILTGDGLNGAGVVAQSGNAWVLPRLPIALAADHKLTIAANPLDFTVRAGTPSTPCVLGITAINGVPIGPVVLASGLANATGQWVKHYASTTGVGVTVTFQAAGFDTSLNLLLSNTVDVQFL
jgi:hypothetical protein